MWNSNKPIKFPHPQKLANQSTMNKAHVIEIKKACNLLLWKQEKPSLLAKNKKHRQIGCA